MISIGYYSTQKMHSPFITKQVGTIPEAQLWLKNMLPWLEKNSYGLLVWETNSWDNGPGNRAKAPTFYLSWHNDGTDCFGRLYNPATGWCFIVREDNKIHEEHFPPEQT